MTRARYFLALYRIFRHTKSPINAAVKALRESFSLEITT